MQQGFRGISVEYVGRSEDSGQFDVVDVVVFSNNDGLYGNFGRKDCWRKFMTRRYAEGNYCLQKWYTMDFCCDSIFNSQVLCLILNFFVFLKKSIDRKKIFFV